MHNHSITGPVASRLRAIGGVGVLTVAMLAGTAGTASAASVAPTPINDGNPTCASFDAGWTELKVDNGLGNGTFTDGTLEVTISNFQNSNAGTPGSFEWSSNIGIDAVFVKAGNDKHNLFVYDPESTGDTDLGPQAGQGNGISHISFCYDEDDAPPPPDEPEPPVDEPPADEPPGDEPTPPSDEPSSPDDPAPSPSGEVQGVTGTPKPTLPPTDTLSSTDAGSVPALPALIAVLSLVTLTGILTVRMPSRTRR
ncbi:MAG TPA: hypothetical protein VFO05_06310 [Candidatus Limnocylindrales bacterium]|nr:hypothetical protein [Candidatus Limnocylindrales bacterium]